jgi:hypothetical protein
MSVQPQYAAVPLIGFCQITVANTNRDGSGTLGQLCVGRAPGTRVDKILVRATGTTTAGIVRIYHALSGLTLNADGTIASFAAATKRLIGELSVTAYTPSSTQKAFGSAVAGEGDFAFPSDFVLGQYEALYIAPEKAETFNCFAVGGHL